MSRKRTHKAAPRANIQANGMYLQPQKRKSSALLTLALMGGVALVALNSCDDESSADDNHSDGVFFSSTQQCIDAGHSAQVCTDAWNKAKEEFEKEVPAHLTRYACESSYGNGQCYYDSSLGSYFPLMAGFLLAQAIQQNRNDPYYSGNGYLSRPVWTNSGGDYSWRSGSATASSSGKTIVKSSTVSRGGFGRSSSARGSWGG